ncbi:hypothetical protein SRHO_G00305870 [Serrasalmus rhombeus]
MRTQMDYKAATRFGILFLGISPQGSLAEMGVSLIVCLLRPAAQRPPTQAITLNQAAREPRGPSLNGSTISPHTHAATYQPHNKRGLGALPLLLSMQRHSLADR